MGNARGKQTEKNSQVPEQIQMNLDSQLKMYPDKLANNQNPMGHINIEGSNRNRKFDRQKQSSQRRQDQQRYQSKSAYDAGIFQELLQRYTNNTRMQTKQQSIELACPQIVNQNNSAEQKQKARRELKKWLTQTCQSVFSIAYQSYKKGEISESQMKIYCSQNLLLNLIKLSKQNNLNMKDYKYLDTVLKDDILSYYKKKYPPTLEKQVYKKLRGQIQQIDAMEDFQRELVKTSNLEKQFGKRYLLQTGNKNPNPQYYDLLMRFINHCLELPDQNCKSKNKQSQSNHFDEFYELMTTMFTKIENIYYMKIIVAPEMAQKTQLQIKEEQEYKQKVKKYTKYKIGRKIPGYAHKFTDQEIKDKNISIKDPAILRFLTKQLEQLEETLDNIQSKLSSVGKDLNQKYGINYDAIKKIKEQRKKLLDIIQERVYQQQEFCNYSYLQKKQIDTVPMNEKLVGIFSCVASQNLSIYITKSINSLYTIYAS